MFLNPKFVFNNEYLLFTKAKFAPARDMAEVKFLESALRLRPGMKVLDLCCGHGRHSNLLAYKGYKMTGLDNNRAFLKIARSGFRATSHRPRYVCQDMRRMRWIEEFDASYSFFTSFGYFDDEENRKVLWKSARALKPAGRLLLDVPNREVMVRKSSTSSAVVMRTPKIKIKDKRTFDLITGRLHTIRSVYTGIKKKTIRYSVRLYSYTELRSMLQASNLKVERVYGGLGVPYNIDSRRMVLVAKKQKER